jgi:hypothetical protein
MTTPLCSVAVVGIEPRRFDQLGPTFAGVERTIEINVRVVCDGNVAKKGEEDAVERSKDAATQLIADKPRSSNGTQSPSSSVSIPNVT